MAQRQIFADEPRIGGGDINDPYTLSSLASCKLITLRMYIDRKGWEIDQIAISVNLYQETKNELTTTIIDCDILFLSPVSDEQKLRLLEIAKSCPVSKILQGDLKVRVFAFRDGETKQSNTQTGDYSFMEAGICQHSTRC
jgi:putative redox protein